MRDSGALFPVADVSMYGAMVWDSLEYSPSRLRRQPPGILLDRRQRTGRAGPLRRPASPPGLAARSKSMGFFLLLFLFAAQEQMLENRHGAVASYFADESLTFPLWPRGHSERLGSSANSWLHVRDMLDLGNPDTDPPIISRQVRSAALFRQRQHTAPSRKGMEI